MRSEQNDFIISLIGKLSDSLLNEHTDNFDLERFEKEKNKISFKETLKKIVLKNNYVSKYFIRKAGENLSSMVLDNLQQFINIYDNLNDANSKKLLIDILAYRILGHTKVKLSRNCPERRDHIESVKKLADRSQVIHIDFMNWKLFLHDLHKIGLLVKLYGTSGGIVSQFIEKQYEYNSDNIKIKAQAGDVVIDAGACWGDSALYFANIIGNAGIVYSFEFIKKNIEIFNKNISLNPSLSERIILLENPLYDHPDIKISFDDHGPGSTINSASPGNSFAITTSIDHLTEKNVIKKVNFIKMDIEGSELAALKGAIHTIKKFRPKLAIAIYHSINDLFEIPQWILDLDLGYKIYIDHFSIHSEETILFASAE